MNYYEHHLGDYMRDTAHLTMLEDAAYRRLLDAYYGREKPLPTDHKECCKLARATSKQERDAVAYVLREFFIRSDDGHRQKRCDEEIERYQQKQSKARSSAYARWSKTHQEPDANAMRTHEERICETLIEGVQSQCDGNAPNLQSPDTKEENTEKAPPSPVEIVFDHWRETHGHHKAKLDAKRKKTITAALKIFPPEELCRAIEGYKRSAWHQGKNERREVFDDIELMLRDAKHVENGIKFLNGGGEPEWAM